MKASSLSGGSDVGQRKSPLSQEFIDRQRERIQGRINYYYGLHKPREESPGLIEGLNENNKVYRDYKGSVVAEELKKTLELINSGYYGICIDCNCDIPLARLEKVPGASRCQPCGEKVDKKR